MKVDGLKTLFIDIDGTLLYHYGVANQQSSKPVQLLDGVLEKLAEWEMKGYRVILITGRKESERSRTEAQLAEVGIEYDRLIMGISRGDRVIINDMKPDSTEPTAVSVNVKRNSGIANINL